MHAFCVHVCAPPVSPVSQLPSANLPRFLMYSLFPCRLDKKGCCVSERAAEQSMKDRRHALDSYSKRTAKRSLAVRGPTQSPGVSGSSFVRLCVWFCSVCMRVTPTVLCRAGTGRTLPSRQGLPESTQRARMHAHTRPREGARTQRERDTQGQTDRQTERQRDRETERKRDRETERQREREKKVKKLESEEVRKSEREKARK